MRIDHALQLRAELLSNSPSACVARELWSCAAGTYSAYRECIVARQQHQQAQRYALAAAYAGAAATAAGASPAGEKGGHSGGAGCGGGAGGGGRLSCVAHSLPATVKYSFEGVKHVLAEGSAAVSSLAFAPLRSDLLAFGCVDGELYLVGLTATATAQTPPACRKARKMHRQAIQALDWAYDSSQLLSVGHDGSLCLWDATDPAGLSCIRSVSVPTTAFLCGRFHRVNFSLAMVGSSAGYLEVFNCSTGLLDSRYKVPASGGAPVQVTALDSSNHHVFAGDSSGQLHMLACELHHGQLSRLRPTGRLRLAAPGGGAGGSSSNSSAGGGGGAAGAGGAGAGSGRGQPGGRAGGVPAVWPAAVTSLQYLAFCGATDSPVLVAALRDGSICIVRANESRHTAELHLRRSITPPSPANLSPYVTASTFHHHPLHPTVPPASPASTPAGAPRPPAPSNPHPAPGPAAPPPLPPPAVAAAASAAAAAAAAAALTTLLRLRPCVCPMSAIRDVPLVTYGSDDTAVYILDVTARSFGTPGRAGGGGGAGAAGAAAGDRPLTVTVLKAHRAPVASVDWSYDESLLASADADGVVVIWQRSRLF